MTGVHALSCGGIVVGVSGGLSTLWSRFGLGPLQNPAPNLWGHFISFDNLSYLGAPLRVAKVCVLPWPEAQVPNRSLSKAVCPYGSLYEPIRHHTVITKPVAFRTVLETYGLGLEGVANLETSIVSGLGDSGLKGSEQMDYRGYCWAQGQL